MAAGRGTAQDAAFGKGNAIVNTSVTSRTVNGRTNGHESSVHSPTRYRVTADPFFRFQPDSTVEVRSAAKTLLLPQEAFQTLMQFVEPRTLDEVLERMPGLSRDDLATLVDALEEHELVARVRSEAAVDARDDALVDGTRFLDLFRAGVFDDDANLGALAHHLADGRAIVIPDALRSDVAERIHAELSGDLKWQAVEEFDQISHFKFRSLDFERHIPPSALEVRSLANAASTKRLMSRISGRDCEGKAEFSCSWYRPGDFTHPHDDNQAHRSIAAVLNLSKDWDPKWGGSLFWAPSGSHIVPRFNTLTLFNVAATSVHQVIPVSPLALQKRLTLNIWWTNQRPPPILNKAHLARSNADGAGITPHAYGRSPAPLPHGIVAV